MAPDDDDNAVLVVGVITDAETQRPVGGAQVFFTALDIGGLTQRDGNYTIREVPEEGRYVMTLRHACYLTVTVEVELSQAYGQALAVNVGPPRKPRNPALPFSDSLGGC